MPSLRQASHKPVAELGNQGVNEIDSEHLECILAKIARNSSLFLTVKDPPLDSDL